MLDVLGLERAQPHECLHRPRERERHRSDSEQIDHRLRHPAAEEAVDQEAEEREDRDEPKLHLFRPRMNADERKYSSCQYFIELTSSIISVCRFLNTVKIIASPTAASAAATTMTKKL